MYLAASSPVARDHFLMGYIVELIIKESARGREHHSPFALCACICSRYQARNISSMRRSVSSPDETPRRELKIRSAAEYF